MARYQKSKPYQNSNRKYDLDQQTFTKGFCRLFLLEKSVWRPAFQLEGLSRI